MGIFRVKIGIGNMEGGDLQEVDALVDTGATHTMAPGSFLQNLRIRPMYASEVTVASGVSENWDVGIANIAYGGRRALCQVFFGPEGADYLFGATSLEALGFVVDPVAKELQPTSLRI